MVKKRAITYWKITTDPETMPEILHPLLCQIFKEN
jgi:hypothetical protein